MLETLLALSIIANIYFIYKVNKKKQVKSKDIYTEPVMAKQIKKRHNDNVE